MAGVLRRTYPVDRCFLEKFRTERGPERRLGLAVFLAEFVYATSGIDDFLLSGVERVAGGAHVEVEIAVAQRGTRLKRVAATARNGKVVISGMGFRFHDIQLHRHEGGGILGRDSRNFKDFRSAGRVRGAPKP